MQLEPFRVALAQANPQLFEKAANLAKAEIFVQEAASRGAAIILFPELFLTGYTLGKRAVEMAEDLRGPSLQSVAALAARYHIAVVMGYAEISPDGKGAYDAVFFASQRGEILGTYRKTHLFQAETGWFLPGSQPGVFDCECGRVGTLICYDLEFPENARLLRLLEAQWLAVATGNMQPNEHLQRIYVQARAAENRTWVALANRVGREGETVFFGGSAVSDPSGQIVAEAGSEETLLVAEIDLQRSETARQNADYLADRRPELYQALSRLPTS